MYEVYGSITKKSLLDKDDCLELVLYANRLSGYLRGFMNE